MAMVEPFLSVRRDGRVTNLLDPDSTIKSIHIASALGASSAYTWLKLPVVDDLPRVMDSTTLPDAAAGRRSAGRPAGHLRRLGSRARPPGRARPRRRSRPALPAGRRRRRSRRHRRRPVHGSGAMTGRWVLPLGSAEREDWAVVVDEGVEGGSTPVCMRVRSGPGRSAGCRPGARAHGRPALRVGRGPVHRVLRRRVDGAADRPRLGLRRTGRRRLRPPRQRPRPRDDRAVPGRPRRRRGARRAGRSGSRLPAPPGGRRPRRAARSRPGVPRGPQLRGARRARRRVAHRLRGRHPGRQLELVPAAQARHPPRRRRVAAGGDLLPRGPGHRRRDRGRRPDRVPAGLRHGGARDRRPRRGADRRRRPRALRLARPGDGRSGLRPVLPQRHGGTGPRARLADLRRPGARLGPRDLDLPAR